MAMKWYKPRGMSAVLVDEEEIPNMIIKSSEKESQPKKKQKKSEKEDDE